MNDDGTLMTGADLRAFADAHGFAMISIADLVTYLS
jgi:3,4-dihydroxy-2-butanone 4-phosphate synthase